MDFLTSMFERVEAKFRQIVDATPNGIIVVDRSGTIVLANAEMERLFSYSKGELVGQPIEVLVPERFRGEHPAHRNGFFANPQVRSMGAGRDLYGRRKDGTEFPVEIGLNPLPSEEGVFVLASIIDITERRRADERFRLLVEAAPNGMLMVGADGRIALVNAQMESLFGYRQEELIGAPIEVLVPERFQERHPDHRDGFFANPQARAMGGGRDLYGRRKDGSEFPVEIGLNPLPSEEGVFVLASIIDTTERKRADERFRLLVEGVRDYAIVTLDASGYVTSWNVGAERIKMYRPEEIIGRHFSCFYPDEAIEKGWPGQELERATREGRFEDEGWRVRSDGSAFWANVVVTSLWDSTGNLIGFSKITRDLTERRRSEERFRLLVEAAPNGMVIVGADGQMVQVNAQMEKLFGYRGEELVGQPIELLVPEHFRARHPEQRLSFFSNPQARAMGAGRDLYGRRKDGGEFPVEIGLSPIRTEAGPLVLATIIDITERKQVEAEVLQKNRDLETLLHVTSHDLREPLRAVQNFSRLVLERYAPGLDDKGKDFLERIARGADRLDRLLEDILTLSRAQRLSGQIEEVSGAEIVAEALDRLAVRVKETGATIRVAADLPRLRVDRTWATQAVYNLLANALKFTKDNEPPDVEIAAYAGDDGDSDHGLIVRDRGTGVDPEYAERIFQLFQRAVGREVEGTGAGLAIVRQIALRHGGRAWVVPRPGGGSEFIITFEAADSNQGNP